MFGICIKEPTQQTLTLMPKKRSILVSFGHHNLGAATGCHDFFVLFLVTRGDFAIWEQIATFAAVGFVSGTVGINYSTRTDAPKNKLERSLADALLAMVLYSHFKSEHLLVHHTYVGTPRDPVTARYNERILPIFSARFVAMLPLSMARRGQNCREKQTMV